MRLLTTLDSNKRSDLCPLRVDRQSSSDHHTSNNHSTSKYCPANDFHPTSCTKTRLVSEDGERNLWDDILEEQLSKCRPVQTRADRRMVRSILSEDDLPVITTTSGESIVATGSHDEEDKLKTKGEREGLEERGFEDDGGVEGVAAVQGIEDKIGGDALHESPLGSPRFESSVPSLRLLSGALQQQRRRQQEVEKEEEAQRERQQRRQDDQQQGQEPKQEPTAVGLSLAPHCAYLLNEACGTIVDIIQGTDVDVSVVRAVDTAAAAASAAQVAVMKAAALLGKHYFAEIPDSTGTRSKLQCSLSPSTLSSFEIAADMRGRDVTQAEEDPGRCRWKKPFRNSWAGPGEEERRSPSPDCAVGPLQLSPDNISSAGGGTLVRMLCGRNWTGSRRNDGQTSDDESSVGEDDRARGSEKVDEHSQAGEDQQGNTNEEEGGACSSRDLGS